MKVLFLDFDGVLTYTGSQTGNRMWPWNADGLLLLHEIVARTETNIVVSSSWRHACSLDDLGVLLGLEVGDICDDQTGAVIGKTPGTGRIFTHDSEGRGTAITVWLAENGSYVDTWAVVDDDVFDMHPWMLARIVQTESRVGLTSESANELIALLGE